MHHGVGGLMQKMRNPIANSLELRLLCTKPSMWYFYFIEWIDLRGAKAK